MDFFHQRDEWAIKAWLLVVIVEVSYLGSHLIQTILSWYLRDVAKHCTNDG